ncbi:hypothetical protein [Paenibacillus popilliae]|nr:hypothetical protein [Paenibacillus popilliae]
MNIKKTFLYSVGVILALAVIGFIGNALTPIVEFIWFSWFQPRLTW